MKKSEKIKQNNIAFYNSNLGCENITEKIPSTDFIESHFQISPPPSSMMLEVGCGTASCLLSLKYAERVGLDISHTNLILAKRRDPNLMLVQADSEFIPFKRVFDLVLVVDLLHHIPKPSVVISEIGKILIDGGRLFIWDVSIDGLKPIYPLALLLRKIAAKIGSDIENFGPSLIQINESLYKNEFRIEHEFGEGTFIRYLISVYVSLLRRVGIHFLWSIQYNLTLIDAKLQKFHFFKNSFLKFGIVAIKGFNN